MSTKTIKKYARSSGNITPRVDVGLSDGVDVAMIFSDPLGSITVIYRPDEAEKHAKLVLRAVKQARQNRVGKQPSGTTTPRGTWRKS
jgi:hypothetical protein